MAIRIYEEGIKKTKLRKRIIKSWIDREIKRKNRIPGEINIILANDACLLELNKKYRSKNYLTDVICFDYSKEEVINGDVFISMERVHENAIKYKQQPEIEMCRVMIHGVLHMIGYRDEDRINRIKMKKEEDNCLSNLFNKGRMIDDISE